MAKRKGTVKWFNDAKGYGFIKPEEEGTDIFVHFTGITGNGFKSLASADVVTFDIAEGEKGPHAINVSRVMP